MHNDLYIGINSGTSIDKIDCALFSFEKDKIHTIATYSLEFPQHISGALKDLSANIGKKFSLKEIGDCQTELAQLYAKACNELIKTTNNIRRQDITAIGCHGQTIYHSPNSNPSYTMQLNNGALIAHHTNIDTIVDFRAADMAANGQGAPLAPAFHHQFLFKGITVAIVNLGGIANITLLPELGNVIGYDTGPANCLMDMWAQKHFNLTIDHNGGIAKSGEIIENLLINLLSDPYFKRNQPKSTGVDYFNLHWLNTYIEGKNYSPKNIMATLCELTAKSIAKDILKSSSTVKSIYLCGGGANNHHLVERIQFHLADTPVLTTQYQGIDPNWVECALFAWLAKMHIEKQPINLNSITGSSHPVILGAHYPTVK